jgi:cellulose synthase/poly-beta-1,6-N-acetylglucosamine synthase-like glycosyltransferase
MKLFLALLTNHKLDKLKRLVRTVELQYPEESIELKPVIVVNTLNDEYYQEVLDANLPFEVVRTESNGKPGKGKNSCMDLFLQSDCDFMTQVDGDDFLYPTFLRSIANHVNHYPDIDVLGRIPLDYLSAREINGGYRFMADESIYA